MNNVPSGNAVIKLTTMDIVNRLGEALRQFTVLVMHLQRVANPEEWGTYGDWNKVQKIGLNALSDLHAFLEYPDEERMNYGIVPMPGTRDQAELMEKLGHDFLLKNAPERLSHRYGTVIALLRSIIDWERENLHVENKHRMPGLEIPPAPWLLEAERAIGSGVESGFRAHLLPVDLLAHVDDALDKALDFMVGFEGDSMQEGIDERLQAIRESQTRLRQYMRPADLEAIVGTGAAIEAAAEAIADDDAQVYADEELRLKLEENDNAQT